MTDTTEFKYFERDFKGILHQKKMSKTDNRKLHLLLQSLPNQREAQLAKHY